MLIQVYGQEKPALRRRTITAAISLLAISTGLAASLTWESKGTRPGLVFIPRGWSISVRPPPGAVARTVELDSGRGFQLTFPTSTGDPAQMLVLRLMYLEALDLQTAVESVFLSLEQLPAHAAGRLRVVWHKKVLGGHDAVEIWDPETGHVVRVGRVQSGELYAIVFRQLRIAPETYDIFERVCHSIEDASR